jgi:hypothetical protein
MRTQMISAAMALLLLGVGCGSPDGSISEKSDPATTAREAHLNVAPATLEEGAAELERANTLLAAGADPTRITGELQQLREHMDGLNGLVDRVEIAKNHTVAFYKTAEGIVVGERSPQGTASAVAGLDLANLSVTELHLQLAPQQPVPQVLLDSALATQQAIVSKAAESEVTAPGAAEGAPAAAVGPLQQPGALAAENANVKLIQSALTDGDGAYFRDHFCPEKGFYFYCYPNAGNWFHGNANATHSDLIIAPTSPGVASTALHVNGKSLGVFAAFNGEIDSYWAISGTHSVRDGGCCFICACGTHPEVLSQKHQWDVTASGVNFHIGGYFMNDPRHLSAE